MSGWKKCTRCDALLPATLGYFNAAKWIKSGLRPDCKTCYAASKKVIWERDGEAKSPNRARYRALKTEAQNGVRTCKSCNETKALTGEFFSNSGRYWNSDCRECGRAKTKLWVARNSEKHRVLAYMRCAERYARKADRTPKWLSREHRREILEIYERSSAMRDAGNDVHVDHIVPLVGRLVSGLHVPWNLRIIPARENLKKHRTFEVA